MKRLFTLTALSFMLALFFTASMARADDVDQRIRNLENELNRLKTEQTQVKAEQIELKKNALAAEGALPTFTYRAGNGLMIEAADKAWGMRISFESHMRMLFETGHQHAGRTNGEVMGRRFRPRWNFCVENCFYEIEASLDLDGFGTNSALQRGVVWLHFEQASPWLPTMYLGMDGPASINEYESGSSSTGSQMEYGLLRRNNGINTGSSSQIIGFNWDDKPLDAIGIPGRISRINLAMGGIGEAGDGQSSFRDSGHNFVGFAQLQPFSQTKSKWIEGIGISGGAWICNNDTSPNLKALGVGESAPANACSQLQIRDNGDGGRQILFGTATTTPLAPAGGIGRGWAFYYSPGFQWAIGPYALRASGGFQSYQNGENEHASITTGKTIGKNFLIAHDLFVWSPKGWFTGSSATAGSVLFGTHFERTDVDCNSGGGKNFGAGGCTGFGFNRNTILLREWDLWYFVASRLSVGMHFLWYDATNLPKDTRFNLGLQKRTSLSARGGSWTDMNLNLRYTF